MADPNLDAQIAAEKAQIDSAPKIPIKNLQPQTGRDGRCWKCGRISKNLIYLDTVHGQDRWVGAECCGGRHG